MFREPDAYLVKLGPVPVSQTSFGSGSNVLKGKIILQQLNSLDLLLSSSIWIRNTIFIHTTWADILSILTLRVFKTLHVSLDQYNFFYKSVFILHFYIYALFYPTFFILITIILITIILITNWIYFF